MTQRMLICAHCGAEAPHRWRKQKFCSPECAHHGRRRFEVTAKELEKLVWEMPTIQIAERFGVSDKAIEKRCKMLFVAKPPRGYWAQMKALHALEAAEE